MESKIMGDTYLIEIYNDKMGINKKYLDTLLSSIKAELIELTDLLDTDYETERVLQYAVSDFTDIFSYCKYMLNDIEALQQQLDKSEYID